MKRLTFLLIAFFFITGFIFLSGNSGLRCPQKAVVFDGSNDYGSRANPYGADGKTLTVSFWFKMNGGDGAVQYIYMDTNGWVYAQRQADNTLFFYGWDGAAVAFNLTTTGTFTSAMSWTHVIMSLDTANNKKFIYVNGVVDINVATFANLNIDFNGGGNCAHFAHPNTASKLNADIAEFYLTNEYLDISIASNLDKFYRSGRPAKLGADGSTPTGTQPWYYYSVGQGDTADSFMTNRGSLADFALTGSLTIAATSPCNS